LKTRSAKNKGQRLSKYVRDCLLKAFPALLSDDIIVTPSGVPGEDLRLSPKAREQFKYSIECKNQERLNIWKAIEQAESNCGSYQPIVIFKRNKSKTYVCLEFEHFLERHDSGS